MSSLKNFLDKVNSPDDLTHKHWLALTKKLGGFENVVALLREEKSIQFVEAMFNLFDHNGRRIPKGLQNAVCDPNKDFKLIQPRFTTMDDYAQRVIRFQEAFHPGPMSVADFEEKTRELIDEIRRNKIIVNLLKGVYLPIILPKLENFKDYGTTLEQTLLLVKVAYEKQFPNRNFYNHRKGELVNQVSIVKDTRHEELIERMKKGIVCGIYFPNPLQGFSSLASREQMKDLPESLSLVGGFDASSAMIMYPDILAKDWHTPGYDLSALQWQSSDYSLYFEAYDAKLVFRYVADLGRARGRCSSGLLFLGSA